MKKYPKKLHIIGLLGVLFVGLKLTGYITWSWLWVLSPFWIPAILYIITILIYLGITIHKR